MLASREHGSACLRVVLEKLNELFLAITLRLSLFLPELFAGSGLILLHDLVGDHVDDRVLGMDHADRDDRSDQCHQIPACFSHLYLPFQM